MANLSVKNSKSSMTKKLNDKNIRIALVQKLQKLATPPKTIIEELSVNLGQAIADVVSIHKEAHCYEIKGDGDKIERIEKQGSSYNLAFRRITLVTTEKHAKKSIELAPQNWGILIAYVDMNETIKFKYLRKAKVNPQFDKKTALQTLWKSEMLQIASHFNVKLNRSEMTRDAIIEKVSKTASKEGINLEISTKLTERL